MRRLCAILFLALAHASLAGFSTNYWPSQTHPRQSQGQLLEAYSGVVERCMAAGVSNPAAPTWYRFNRTIVLSFKGQLKTVVPYYLDTRNRQSGSYSNYFATYTNSRALPAWTATGLLVSCAMPTNWFDYTPWRSLSGLGGNTNDASVPYPYGETNATTARGGTNFPAGRTAWYTTDYGYAGVTGLLTKLTDMAATPSVSFTYRGTTNSSGTAYGGYAAAAAALPGVFGYPTFHPAVQKLAFGSYYQNYPGNDYAWEVSAVWYYCQANPWTNGIVWVEWFMNIGPYMRYETGGGLYGEYTNTWSTADQVSGWPKYSLNPLGTDQFWGGTTGLISSVYGTTNEPIAAVGFTPSGSANPTVPWRSTKGWEFWDTHYMVMSFDFVFR
jgi:hypothetical protein